MADKLAMVQEFFEGPVWFLEYPEGARLMGLSIKVDPQGLFCVLKFVTAEGPKVAFYGCKSLEKLYRGLQSEGGREALKLRPDKFALDKNSQSG